MENASQAQTDIREAADYLKGIADNWIADMPLKHDEEMEVMTEKLQDFIDAWKDKVDKRA